MSQRAEQKERTRQHLIEVAAALFAEQGIAGTRTADVAKAAGVSHGTVFVHFKTRDDLIVEVVGYAAGRAARALHDVEGTLDLPGVLAHHLTALQGGEALYARLVREEHALPERAQRSFLGIQSAISGYVTEAYARGVQAGLYKQLVPHLLFNTWVGLVHHYLTHAALFAPEASVLEKKGDELVQHFLALLSV